MRAQPLLNFLRQNYNPAVAANLANNPNINGGWEVWLQVEIALAFVNQGGQRVCVREEPYPSGQLPNRWVTYLAPNAGTSANAAQAARCDFYLHRPALPNQQLDDTYVELKCINPNAANPLADAWNRFNADITKIRAIGQVNPLLNGIALLATYGTFTVPLPQFNGGVTAYVWDPANNVVTTMAGVALNGANRFFIVAVSA